MDKPDPLFTAVCCVFISLAIFWIPLSFVISKMLND